MAGFSTTDAAFTGFRIVWERPTALIFWFALQFAVQVASTAFITLSAGPAFTQAETTLPLNADPAVLMARLVTLAPTYAALIIGGLVLYAVLYAAMNRAVLRPAQLQFGYLRLASDELRQLGLFALMAVLALGLYLAIVVVGSLVAGLFATFMGDSGILLSLAFVLPATFVAFVYLGVRFSLASPLTFDRGRIDLFGSWRLTHGRFWPLFWAYLLAFALNIVVVALILAVAIFTLAIIGGGFAALGQGADANFTSLITAFTPAHVAYLAITAIGQALSLPITATPPASVYRALAGAGQVSRMFD